MLLLAAWGVYAYRDIWPLATFTLQPLDPNNWLTWTTIALLTVAGILVPLFEPHQYVPVDPGRPSESPHPEQTASWVSFIWYNYMDPANVTRISSSIYEKLPPLADYDRAEYLVQRCLPLLDPMIGAKHHLFFGLVRCFCEFTHIQYMLQ